MKDFLDNPTGGSILFWFLAAILLIGGCKKSGGPAANQDTTAASQDTTAASQDTIAANGKNQNAVKEDTGQSGPGEKSDSQGETLMEKTSGMIKSAADSSLQAANSAGGWIQDKVQASFESSKQATMNVGKKIQDIFQLAKGQGSTTANNVLDFVKEDIARLGTWQYTSRTVTHENPQEVVSILNRLGKDKWECFWVDKQATQTTLYFKKPPKSYTSNLHPSFKISTLSYRRKK